MAAMKSCDFIFICLKNIYKSTYVLRLKLHFYYALYHLNSILTVSLIFSPIKEDADPLLMRTITGLPLTSSPFLAKNFLVSDGLRPFVDTISPSFKKKSVIFIA